MSNPESLNPFYATALEHTGVSIWLYNVSKKTVTYSQEWQQTLGLSDVQPVLAEILSRIHPQDRHNFQQSLMALAENKEVSFKKNHRMLHALGHSIWVQTSAKIAAYNAIQGVLSIVGTQIEISQKKAKESQLQAALHEVRRTTELLKMSSRITQAGWWWVDLKNNTVHWSAMTRKIHEVHDNYQPTPETAIKFYAEEDRERINKLVEKTLQTGASFSGEFKIITAKKNVRWVRTACELERRHGQPVKLFGSFQNITEYKQNEHKLTTAKHKAEAASRSKSEFLTNMSHEIRTPLNGVIGFSELLKYTSLNEVQHKYVDAVMSSGISLTELLNDLLDYSKIEGGQMQLEIKKVLLSEWIQNISDKFTQKAHEKNLHFSLAFDNHLPEHIWVDIKALSKVLSILFSNALKFTSEGGIELKIEWVRQRSLRCSLRDTGIGIAPEHRQKIFELFTQIDGSSTRQHEGSGLGLNICTRLLELMQSKLEFNSVLNDGSTFFFEIEMKSEGKLALPKSLPTQSFKRALITDPNKNNRKILEGMFALLHIETVSCSNGQEALQHLKNDVFDLAIIDYQMPVMNGLQLIEEIRTHLSLDADKLTLLLFHSAINTEIQNACRKFNVLAELVKPLTFSQLQHLLKPPAPQISPSTSIKIMVVDDNEINRMITCSLLHSIFSEATIYEAQNGEDALQLYGLTPPDIILLDLQMPIMDGYAFVDNLFESYPEAKTPILAMSAETKSEKNRCLQTGMQDFLQKPLDAERLKKTISHWLSDQAPLKHAHINYAVLHQRMGNLELNLTEIRTTICQDFKLQIQTIRQAILDNDNEQIQVCTQRIRGSAGYMCFEYLTELTQALEKLEDIQTEDFNECLNQIETEVNLLQKLPLAPSKILE